MDRAGPIAAFILLALLAALSPQLRASESFLLRWIPPPESDVAGYNVYLAAGCAYPDRSDIGLYALDPSGIASFPLALPEDADEYHVMLTAYADNDATCRTE